MPNLPSTGTIQRSASDFIKSALRLVGSLGSGEDPPESELTDAQQALNDMLDSWSAQRTSIFTVPRVTVDQNQNTLVLIANQQALTLGNSSGTENLLLARPPRLDRVAIMYSASQQTPVEVPLEMLDDVQWEAISNKSTPSLLPQTCFNDKGFPDMTLSFWPIPTQANPIVLYPWIALQQFADLKTKFSFPPAYARAIRYNLAVDLAAEFPGDLQKLPLVMKIAGDAKRYIESINAPTKVAFCDPAIVGSGGPRGNIYTGAPSRSTSF